MLSNINVSRIYNYADQLLSPWDQRPVFKSNVTQMISLRQCKPRIEWEILRKLPTYFPTVAIEHSLSPANEPTLKPKDSEKELIFYHLQKLTSLNLVKPKGEDHMYFAALNSKSCLLTPPGRFYWNMIVNKMP